MTSSPSNISRQIAAQAKFIGASLSGIADAKLLKQSPSHFIYPRMEHNLAVGSRKLAEGIELGQVAWPANAKSVVVVAAEHKKDEPDLDWWDRQKVRINRANASSIADAASLHALLARLQKINREITNRFKLLI